MTCTAFTAPCGASSCGRDARSTEHGYGPVCARSYGLPWNTGSARQLATQNDAAARAEAAGFQAGTSTIEYQAAVESGNIRDAAHEHERRAAVIAEQIRTNAAAQPLTPEQHEQAKRLAVRALNLQGGDRRRAVAWLSTTGEDARIQNAAGSWVNRLDEAAMEQAAEAESEARGFASDPDYRASLSAAR